jgi:glycosyltransferase involved in cell wall biosynthesis
VTNRRLRQTQKAWKHFMDSRNAVPSSFSIGYYSPGWPLTAFCNGIVTYVATIAPTLKAMGHQVSILAYQVVDSTQEESVYDIQQARASRSMPGRVVDRLWSRVAPRSASRHIARRSLLTIVRRAIAERGIEIIEMEESFGSARWVRQATSIPVCVRLHGPWFLNGTAAGVPDDGAFRKRVREEGRAIRVADAVTAPSRNVLEQVREFYGLALPEAEVIPPPTSPVPAAERWRLEDCNPKQVLFIGRFDRHKGGDLIIEAFGRVLQEVPEARLRFVGPDRGCIASDGRKWNLENFIRDRIPGALETDRVEWLGQAPQPYPALAQLRRGAMVSVICSRYENFPLTVLEAMALGCPIVAANAGGITEILQDGVNGLLHRAGNPSDIAAKIIHLLKNPAQAAELGRQAAADCERRFCLDVVASRMVEFYRRIISRQALLPRDQHGGDRPRPSL